MILGISSFTDGWSIGGNGGTSFLKEQDLILQTNNFLCAIYSLRRGFTSTFSFKSIVESKEKLEDPNCSWYEKSDRNHLEESIM
jgi:hypothetical protein